MIQTEERQREQTEWLRKYHQWLRSLPVLENGGKDQASLDLKGRLNLLEWSVLMQSEELQRTKRAFLQELHPLQEELQHKSEMLEHAEEREAQLRSLPDSTTTLNQSSKPLMSTTNVKQDVKKKQQDGLSSLDRFIRDNPSVRDEFLSSSKKNEESDRVLQKLVGLHQKMQQKPTTVKKKKKKTMTSYDVAEEKATYSGISNIRMLESKKENGGDLYDINSSPAVASSTISDTADVEATIDWIQYFDPKTKRHYYFNEKLGKTQWEKPSKYRAAVDME